MSKRIDLKGRKFGYLEVLEFDKINNTQVVWKCLCTLCNRHIAVFSGNLIQGNTTKCSKCAGRKIIGKKLEQVIDYWLKHNRCTVADLHRVFGFNRKSLKQVIDEYLERNG